MNMKKTFALWLLAASLMVGIATVGYAQNTTTTTTPYLGSAPATGDQRAPPKRLCWPAVWGEDPVQMSTHCLVQGCNGGSLRVTVSTSAFFSMRRSG